MALNFSPNYRKEDSSSEEDLGALGDKLSLSQQFVLGAKRCFRKSIFSRSGM